MQKLSEDTLRGLFDNRTYERGLDYYENGHVLKPARFNDTIYAKVIGSTTEPYEVSVKINGEDTRTGCTCPVGGMCKHGVALLLKWIREPKTFSDRGKIYQALEKKSKEELLDIIKKAIDEHPYLIDDLNIRIEGVKDAAGVDADILIKRVKRMLSDEDSYYSTSVVKRFDDIRDAADMLMKNERYADASRVYLELVGAGLKIFGDFLEDDDIGDEAAGLVERSIKRFNECAPHASESDKEKLWDGIFRVVGLDEWGMDIEDLFYGVVTKENVGRLESRLMGGEKEPMDEGVFYYSTDGAIDLLDSLYEHLDITREKEAN
jgi:uncharacterized Zn finger protein